ncbi:MULTISPECIES: GNAT family N-acetyltransferase [unclassified Pseudomonas]|uniref:GNAT family N-acetyltransferase n=1 Tax=unclassified Pseudomonas TaxID=196821 RepID=UPI002AC9DB55|nr:MULTISPECIES: GNAT family N-acetyltransferase [unclassified Pseudomonas]MEB0045973.1 GNAT family N-acetyltransferase [Pseudomonas sp. Dout3]MEB0097233.1 GNAT family N-acetyltransferase [Pseudomonas sp. DC1.2]WPX56829.1 GNAT family N-acetyltransferase [Pseudomonas sp. DC1.2]
MYIRARVAADDNALAALWERSVRATHDFLTEDDVQFFYPLVRDAYLPALTVWVGDHPDGTPAGFIATSADNVQMLFVEPAQRGQGVGRQLLDHVKFLHDVLSVDVSEQNAQAHGFYLHYGFEQIGRSQRDGQGRPFPVIHLALKPS